MSEQVWWYATRAAGLMTWATATASVVVGLLLTTRTLRNRTGPWLMDLHRFLGGISVVFLIAHLATLSADSFVEFGAREIFVPGASEWKPEAIAWGIIAGYMLVAVQLSSLLRSHLNRKVWAAVHLLAFAAMVAGSYHAITAGSDIDNPVTWAIAGIGSLLTIALIAMRLQRKDPEDPNALGVSDNRIILEEMRQRLADLEFPRSDSHPQLSVDAGSTLPRREPISAHPLIVKPDNTDSPESTIAFTDDPFDSVPANDLGPPRFSSETEDQLGDDPIAPRGPWSDDGADLFEDLGEDPFEALGVVPEPEDLAEAPEPAGTPGLFSTAARSELATEPVSNPFEPVVATTAAIQSPAPEPPTDYGPPPLPTALDPLTGEPDEAAYTVWLKDWLAYAERYGDEALDDPARV